MRIINLGFPGIASIDRMMLNKEQKGGILTLGRVLIFEAGYIPYLAAALWIILWPKHRPRPPRPASARESSA